MGKQVSRRPTKQDQRKERREEHLRREAQRKREEKRRRVTIISAVAAVVLAAGLIITYVVYAQNQPQTPQVVNPQYPPVDNIYCESGEQLAFHIHAHLSIYINGQALPLPAQVGIASDQSCLYWLHTHDTTGVIHMEAPVNQSFVLGNFLDEWSNQFSSLGYPAQLDQSGWQAYVDGKLYKGDFHKIPLQAHSLITLVYNSPHAVPDKTYNWNGL